MPIKIVAEFNKATWSHVRRPHVRHLDCGLRYTMCMHTDKFKSEGEELRVATSAIQPEWRSIKQHWCNLQLCKVWTHELVYIRAYTASTSAWRNRHKSVTSRGFCRSTKLNLVMLIIVARAMSLLKFTAKRTGGNHCSITSVGDHHIADFQFADRFVLNLIMNFAVYLIDEIRFLLVSLKRCVICRTSE
jgi:hypothetical protein